MSVTYDIAIVDRNVALDEPSAWRELDALFTERDAAFERNGATFVEQEQPLTPTMKRFYETLVRRYPCISTLTEREAAAGDSPWATGPLRLEFAGILAHVALVRSRAVIALPFILSQANLHGLTIFDLDEEVIHRPGGLPGLVLQMEDRHDLPEPTLQDVRETVASMAWSGGPGFVTLGEPGGDYVEVTGSRNSYTVQWHEFHGDAYRHWLAVHDDSVAGSGLGAMAKGALLRVFGNEKLDGEEACSVLEAFAQGRGRPEEFDWRDVTEDFE